MFGLNDVLSSVVGYVGAGVVCLALLDALFHLLNGIRIHFLAAPVNLKEKYGDWAVVTGCTDGIGQAYAHELASRGINIVLISRTLEKLKRTAADIESQHGVQTKIIAVDLSEGKTSIEAVRAQLGDKKIAILVNNVGFATAYPKPLADCSETELWNMMNLNVGITTLMTRLILPGMKDEARGAIVNVSSMSEASPWALFNVYAASKIYIKYFTEGLRVEYADSGVTIQLLSPGLVATKLSAFNKAAQKSKLVATTPQKFARSAVRTLGLTDTTTGYWLHGFQYYFIQRIPLWILKPLGYSMSKMGLQAYHEQLKSKEK